MIPFEQALQIVLRSARPLDSERVELGESLGRILAEDVASDMDLPPFNKSAQSALLELKRLASPPPAG